MDHKRKRGHGSSQTSEPGSDLWTEGLVCAFEFIQGRKKSSGSRILTRPQTDGDGEMLHVPCTAFSESSSPTQCSQINQSCQLPDIERFEGGNWIPIGWTRISEIVRTVQADSRWASQKFGGDHHGELTIADLAAPYWELPVGPIWWCHVSAGHDKVDAWLGNKQWLHPAISLALRDESQPLSEKRKELTYELPVRVAGGLLFELVGQSSGVPLVDEDDLPIVLRCWQAQNFLVTVMHVKGTAPNINVIGIAEVQELLSIGGYNIPTTAHEVIAHLACRLSKWDDRLFRKAIFGAADAVECKFMIRRTHEDMNLFSIILNQEISNLSIKVMRVKWSLHAREETVFELNQHLRGNAACSLLEQVIKNTREMIEEQEAVRDRLFTIQDVLQGTVRAWLQDRNLRVTHNLTIFGGCGLVLSTIIGLFGVNVDGIPATKNKPYAFGLFSALLVVLGVVLIALGLLYFGVEKPFTEQQIQDRKLKLQESVEEFQRKRKTGGVGNEPSRRNLPPTAGDVVARKNLLTVIYDPSGLSIVVLPTPVSVVGGRDRLGPALRRGLLIFL